MQYVVPFPIIDLYLCNKAYIFQGNQSVEALESFGVELTEVEGMQPGITNHNTSGWAWRLLQDGIEANDGSKLATAASVASRFCSDTGSNSSSSVWATLFI